MKRLFISNLILLLAAALSAQIANPYLFLKWKNKDDQTLYVGQLKYDDDFETELIYNKKEYVSNEDSKKSYFDQVTQGIMDMPEGKTDLSFYIHGFGAYRSYFVKLNNSTLQKEIFNRENSTVGMHLTYSWDLGFNYVGGIPKAVDIGSYYGDIMAETIRLAKAKNPDCKIYLITHSMGNRVYLGIFQKLKAEFGEAIIEHHVMAAPDVEQNIFFKEDGLKEFGKVSKEVTIYRHNTDRILTVSGEVTDSTRLGLTGLTDEMMKALPQNLQIVDCSLLNDNERYDFGNHNYYYQSPTVRNDIYHALFDADKCKEHRKVLGHPRRFVLQFPEASEVDKM